MVLKPSIDWAVPDLSLVEAGVRALEGAFDAAKAHVKPLVTKDDGRFDADKGNERQQILHGLSYFACELEAARQTLAYARAVGAAGKKADLEELIAAVFTAGCLRRWRYGSDISGLEQIPAAELGLTPAVLAETLDSAGARVLVERAGGTAALTAVAELADGRGNFGDMGIDDDLLREVQSQFQRFSDDVVAPIAEHVHRKDELIGLDLIGQLAEQGVFGITIPEQYGGSELGKMGMVIVTEELTRGYIGVGSLGTRAEIAAELILTGGTDEQKQYWLPRIAAGEVLPTAVFTEPNFGSDLANIKTRATKNGDGWLINGQKTWITHGSRADLMTLLARSDAGAPGYKGLSMFLVTKTRGTEDDPFPDEGVTGSEIPVIGYRGMKEYEISFDDFKIPSEALLGGEEGRGFKQLMETFESARIQTAARGVGLARAGLELAYRYAKERKQFAREIFDFPRVYQKIARMIVDTQAARQLTYFAARMKESGKRCDLEAGMAKLLATKVAFYVADAGVQVHGGNGYAEEYPISRVFCDARVLSIFEGANEIQAHVIARRVLED
ncbi:MAG: acyl-CoA/acyl-ACP dehydrogenase [Deltaproteobacteria bacterium]|nr:acyl-CoA/acyl-ACP dehydrogenase [Deltaproteobacteria bacterium]